MLPQSELSSNSCIECNENLKLHRMIKDVIMREMGSSWCTEAFR